MSTLSTSRIRIEDLPPLELLSEEEMARIFGAGRQQYTQLRMETLERRELMAANLTASLTGGVLRIEGTGQSDVIVVGQRLGGDSGKQLVIENLATDNQFDLASVNWIEVLGEAGDDFIELPELALSGGVRVRGGAGADAVVASSQAVFADFDPALDQYFAADHDSAAQYYERVRAELTDVFRDEYGFVVTWHGTEAGDTGEATYFTAVAATAIAAETFKLGSGARLDAANQELKELLDTLLTDGWSVPDGLGRSFPIRHTDDIDYIKRDVKVPIEVESQIDSLKQVLTGKKVAFEKELVPLRQSPLARDGFGQILTAVYYAYTSPRTSDEVKQLARDLVQKYSEFLVLNQWRLYAHAPAEQWLEEIYNASGNAKMLKGPETYILFPHERYALQNVAAKMGIATSHWDIWKDMGTSLNQEAYDAIAALAGKTVDAILRQANVSIPYDVQVGPDRWDFHVKGSLDISISDSTRHNVVKVFEDAIRETGRAQNLVLVQQTDLIGLAINRIVNLLPEAIGPDSWRSVLSGAFQQLMPWATGKGWVEAATFISSLQLLKAQKDSAVGYTVWTIAAEMEARPEMADLLRPFLKEYYYNFLRPKANNDHPLWAWLAGDGGRVSEHLDRFVAEDPRRWDDYAWHRNVNEFYEQADAAYSGKRSSRLDYVVLHALHDMGAPMGLTGVALNWRDRLVDAARSAADRLVAQISKTFNETGKYVQERWDAAAGYITERWDAAGNYVTEKFNAAGDLIRETWNQAGRQINETLRNGVLIAKSVREGAREVTQLFTSGKLSAETIVENGVKVAQKAWKDGVNTLNYVWNSSGQKVSEYWRDGAQEFRNLYTNGVRTAYSAWNNGISTVHYTYNAAGEFVTKFWRDGTKEITQWFTNAKMSAETIVQNGVKIAEKAWKDGVNTLNRVRDAAGKLVSEYWRDGSQEFRNLYTNGVRTTYTAWTNGVNTVNYVWNSSGQKVSEYWRDGAQEFRNLYTSGVRTAYTTWTNGVNMVHNTYNAAGQFVTKFWRDGTKEISQWFTSGKVSAENIVQNGVKISEKAWKDGVNTLNRVRDAAGKLVSEYWRDGSQEFRNLYTNGVRTAYSSWNNGVNTVHYVWNTSGQKVSEYWRDGAKEFTNVYKDGVRVAQNVWENGKNIAQHAWDKGGNYLGNALSNSGKAAQDWLGKVGIKF